MLRPRIGFVTIRPAGIPQPKPQSEEVLLIQKHESFGGIFGPNQIQLQVTIATFTQNSPAIYHDQQMLQEAP